MHEPIQLTNTIPPVGNSIRRAPLRRGFVFILLALASFALFPAPRAFGVIPAPDGGYSNGDTAEGTQALFRESNTNGCDNTAIGFQTLFNNTGGCGNTAIGAHALFSNTFDFNTFEGGNYDTATGAFALYSNTTGNNNTAEGFQALENSTGSNNIALGANAGISLTTGSNNIDIGAFGVAGESNTIRIGVIGLQKNAYMQGITGAAVASGVTVMVGSNGKLGTIQSSARYKEAIKPMNKTSEAILALKPVTFRYKKELDPDGIPQFGLVAEQVEKVNPDLVARDEQGKVNTVRYEAVNAMLLNEFLKEHKRVEEQQKEIAALAAQLKEQAALIRKVSDRFEVGKAAPQLVANNR